MTAESDGAPAEAVLMRPPGLQSPPTGQREESFWLICSAQGLDGQSRAVRALRASVTTARVLALLSANGRRRPTGSPFWGWAASGLRRNRPYPRRDPQRPRSQRSWRRCLRELSSDASAGLKGSHHARAMQTASDTTVLGNFDGARFVHAVTSTFFKRDGKYLVRTEGGMASLASSRSPTRSAWSRSSNT